MALNLNFQEHRAIVLEKPDGTPIFAQADADGNLKVNVILGGSSVSEPLEVEATNFDIRNLLFASDKVDVSGSEVSLSAATLTALETITIANTTFAVTQSTSPWEVSAINLDIRDLVFAQDSVDISGSTLGANSGVDIGDVTINNATLAVTQSTSPWVVSGTVALDAGTLAALETIELGATTLAALETIELGATTLAALETITADTELPAAAALADNTANPTVPGVGAFLMGWDVTNANWDRIVTGTPAADNVATSSFNGLLTVSAMYMYDGTAMDRVRGTSANGLAVDVTQIVPGTGVTNLGKAEDQASANTDVGVAAMVRRLDTPVANAGVSNDADYTSLIVNNLGKLWTASDYAEDGAHTSGDILTAIAGVRNTANSTLAGTDGDYAPIAVDIMSGAISGVRRKTTTLTAINTDYDTTTTETNNSAGDDCSMFRKGSFNAIVTETGTATDITFTLQFSNDGGTTWFDYRVGPWVKYRFDDATIAAHTSGQLKICEPFECVAPMVRMSVTGTGLLAATNFFTVANGTFEYFN